MLAVASAQSVDKSLEGLPGLDVSICIASWNCRDRIRDCLHSIYAQKQGCNFEVIVVDNGSTDGAGDLVAREFPSARLVRNGTNVGFSRANNQAAKLARGRHLLFLNNDTVVPAGTLRRLVQFADAHPDIGMIGPRLMSGDGSPQISYRRRPTLMALLHRISIVRWTGICRSAYRVYRRASYNPEGIRNVEALLGAVLLIPRKVFEQLGPWDEDYPFGCEDLDLSTRIGKQKPIVYFGSVEIVHYGREASRTNIGFAAPNLEIGYVQFLRKTGLSNSHLLFYKLLLTVDVPLHGCAKLIQTGWRLLRGDWTKAQKSWLTTRGMFSFFCNDLGRFWRA